MQTKAFYIPNGPKNLAPLFPDVDFEGLADYFVEVIDSNGDTVASSALSVIGGCCEEDKMRIHFLNSLGTVDAINFKLLMVDHETKSDPKETATSWPLNKPDHGPGRFNVRSRDTYTAVNTDYSESDRDWLDELFDSPMAWLEWKGTQGQNDSYIPLIILDKKIAKISQDDRFIYEVTLEFKTSYDRFIIRN